MIIIRKQYNDQFKFKVALEVIKGLAIINEIASRFHMQQNQVQNWKKQLTDDSLMVFELYQSPKYSVRVSSSRL